jgi:hypothetical protein
MSYELFHIVTVYFLVLIGRNGNRQNFILKSRKVFEKPAFTFESPTCLGGWGNDIHSSAYTERMFIVALAGGSRPAIFHSNRPVDALSRRSRAPEDEHERAGDGD